MRGNGKIIQELERNFRGAGWNVIKVDLGLAMGRASWPAIRQASWRQLMEECVDGEYQDFKSKDGAYIRENFFGRYPETAALVADWSDEKIWRLTRGGHDPSKVYAAYDAAVRHKNQPTCILAKTVKGYGMGPAIEATMLAHQSKKMDIEALKHFRDNFRVPLADADLSDLPLIALRRIRRKQTISAKPRESLGGSLPVRRRKSSRSKFRRFQRLNAT